MIDKCYHMHVQAESWTTPDLKCDAHSFVVVVQPTPMAQARGLLCGAGEHTTQASREAIVLGERLEELVQLCDPNRHFPHCFWLVKMLFTFMNLAAVYISELLSFSRL